MSNLCRADFAASSVEHSLFPLLEENGAKILSLLFSVRTFLQCGFTKFVFYEQGKRGTQTIRRYDRHRIY